MTRPSTGVGPLLAVLWVGLIGGCGGQRSPERRPREAGRDAAGSPGTFTFREVEDAVSRKAVCNNGEAATYFVRAGRGADAANVLVFLEGGGSCATRAACAARWRNTPARMRPARPGEVPADTGIVSATPSDNPDFHSWSMVFIPYCSSDLHAGDRPATDEMGGFAFRGSRIVEAIFEDLLRDDGPVSLRDAKALVLAGGSAGGVGVTHHLDRVAGRLPDVRVLGVADSATGVGFTAAEPRDGGPLSTHPWRPRPDESCVAALGEAASRCVGTDNQQGRFVTTPLFLLVDQDDGVLEQLESPDGAGDAARRREVLQAWTGGGVYGPRFGLHVLTRKSAWTDRRVVHTDGKPYSAAEVIGNWVFDRPGPTRVIDTP